MKKNHFFLLNLVALFLWACSPKVAPTVPEVSATKVTTKKQPVMELSPCQKWLNETFEEDALQNHVLYRDQMKQNNFDDAFPLWEEAYKMAPAADGQRDVHYMDGAKIYKHFYFKAGTSEADKKMYREKIMSLYEQAIECYPKKASAYKALIAYDKFYTFPGMETDENIYGMYKEIVDAEGVKTSVSVLNPFTSLVVNLLLEEKIPMPEAQKYANKILEIFEHNKKEKTATQWKKQGWDIVESYTPPRLEQLEGVAGFYDCDYYKNKYAADVAASTEDCDVIKDTYGRLKWGQCPDMDAELMRIKAIKDDKCKVIVEATAPSVLRQAYDHLEGADYKKAASGFDEFANSTDDMNKKAKYKLLVSKIYYAHLKNYSKSRAYAREAAKLRSGWGDPYILIGKLYASSGPLCGPGTGWDSQIVTWPAIDKWNKAKSIDPNVAKEANKLIARYRQYMPSKGDIFQRSMNEGDSFKVKCWIQETTTIRAAPKQ